VRASADRDSVASGTREAGWRGQYTTSLGTEKGQGVVGEWAHGFGRGSRRFGRIL